MSDLAASRGAPPARPLPPVRVRVAAAEPGHTGGNRFRLQVEIRNPTSREIVVVSRHWRVIDADHRVTELRGPCLPDHRPRVAAGASFAFPTELRLATDWGSVEGVVHLLDENGALLAAPLERVVLAAPAAALG